MKRIAILVLLWPLVQILRLALRFKRDMSESQRAELESVISEYETKVKK